jgi:hypothetical protein
MSYYMGDFYRAQRGVRGDPGFFSFLGGLAKKAAGFIPGVGPTVSGVLEGLTHSGAAEAGKMVISRGAKIVRSHPILTAAGGAGILGAGAGAGVASMRRPKVAMVAHGGRGGHRRMRVTNPKALRRAIRRTQGFAKLAMRTIHLVHPKKHVRFGGFRKRRKKAA